MEVTASKKITINAVKIVLVRRVVRECENFKIQCQVKINEGCLEGGE